MTGQIDRPVILAIPIACLTALKKVRRARDGRSTFCYVLPAIALCVVFVQPSCSRRDQARQQDMEQISRLVNLLHGAVPFETGFPPSSYYDPSGKPTISWRLGFAFQRSETPPDINASWKSPRNQAFKTDGRPNSFSIRTVPRQVAAEYAQIFGLVGPGTAFTEFGANQRPDMDTLPNDAILLLECKNKSIHWMEPKDIELDELLKSESPTGIGDLTPNYPDGYLVGFADGAVWYVKKEVPTDAVSKFYTVDGARKFEREKLLGPYTLDAIGPWTEEK